MHKRLMTFLACAAVLTALGGIMLPHSAKESIAPGSVVFAQDVALAPTQQEPWTDAQLKLLLEPDPQRPPGGGSVQPPDENDYACRENRCAVETYKDEKEGHTYAKCSCGASKDNGCDKDGNRNREGMANCRNRAHCRMHCCHCCQTP